MFTATRTRLSFNVVNVNGTSMDSFNMCTLRGCASAPPLPSSLSPGGSLKEADLDMDLLQSLGLQPVPSKGITKPSPDEAGSEVLDSASSNNVELPAQTKAVQEVHDAETSQNAARKRNNEGDDDVGTYEELSSRWWVVLLVLAAALGCLSLAMFACYVRFSTSARRGQLTGSGTFHLDDMTLLGDKVSVSQAFCRAGLSPMGAEWSSNMIDDSQMEMMAAGANVVSQALKKDASRLSLQSS